ncbi:MAG: choice-of-anchor R domain-containing protein, partial [Planctomycetota bacterium]
MASFDTHDTSPGTTAYVFDDGTDLWQGMIFQASASYTLTDLEVSVELQAGAAAYTLTAALYSVSGGHPNAELTSGTLDVSSLTGTPEWKKVEMSSPYDVVSGTDYAIVLKHSTADNLGWLRSNASYANGNREQTANEGSSWSSFTQDLLFRTYGYSAVPSDSKYKRKLAAVANEEFWYESSSGTMT